LELFKIVALAKPGADTLISQTKLSRKQYYSTPIIKNDGCVILTALISQYNWLINRTDKSNPYQICKNIEILMNKKKDLITQEELDRLLKHISDNNYTDKSNQEQVLKVLQEIQIILNEGLFEDSIDGTRIRVKYHMEIIRLKRGEEQVGENTLGFQYVKEIPIDYSKVPISFRDNANTAISDNDINEGYMITESYDILEETSPTLYEILGLLKRIYFMPEDFSNRLAIEHIHNLRNIFSNDEILAFPSASLDNKAGLIPI
jgi:hypothetical protein